MRFRPLTVIGTFAATAILIASNAPSVRAHAGDDNAGHIHACVGSFGGIRIVGVLGSCASTEFALHWNPADRPTTFAAQQSADVLLPGLGGNPTSIPGASLSFTLTNPATIDAKADGAVLQATPGSITQCEFFFNVNGNLSSGRFVSIHHDTIEAANWSMQLNSVSLAAGTHTISLEMRSNAAGGCSQRNLDVTRAKLWVLLR